MFLRTLNMEVPIDSVRIETPTSFKRPSPYSSNKFEDTRYLKHTDSTWLGVEHFILKINYSICETDRREPAEKEKAVVVEPSCNDVVLESITLNVLLLNDLQLLVAYPKNRS
jgi:hypothetical protein